MINIIDALIKSGNAYIINNNVYFDVSTYKEYNILSKRKTDENMAGSRIAIEDEKRSPEDFALWKEDRVEFWESPWGNGRPGWHIECSAMSTKYLGHSFDIHGGGLDLKFPHHENEIAQACAAHKGSTYARYWVHNGFLTINGEKMSKSLGNILYLEDLLKNGYKPEVIRYILISTHYRKPINWNETTIPNAVNSLNKISSYLNFYVEDPSINTTEGYKILYNDYLKILYNDLNTPLAISFLHKLCSEMSAQNINNSNILAKVVHDAFDIIGINLLKKSARKSLNSEEEKEIESLIKDRNNAKTNKDFSLADSIRKQLLEKNITLHDHKDGTTTWEKIEQ